jgi:hypothetical protein
MHHRSRQSTISLAVLLLLLGLGTAARAQSSAPAYTYDTAITNQVTNNTCAAGEPVALTGNMHFQYSFSTDPTSGVNTFTITASNNLNGVGQSTSGNYTASDSADYIISSSQQSTEAVVQLKSGLVSQGASPSLTLVQTLDILVDTSGNISAQVTDNSTQCGS